MTLLAERDEESDDIYMLDLIFGANSRIPGLVEVHLVPLLDTLDTS